MHYVTIAIALLYIGVNPGGWGVATSQILGWGVVGGSRGLRGRVVKHYYIFHSFIPAIFIAPFQVLYYLEALPTTARILYRSFTPKRTGNCRHRTCPRSL